MKWFLREKMKMFNLILRMKKKKNGSKLGNNSDFIGILF